MSATSYIAESSSQSLVDQRYTAIPSEQAGVRSLVRSIKESDKATTAQLVHNVFRIVKFFQEFLRIILSSRNITFQMPESGDIEILNPTIRLGVSNRRRVGLQLDFSDYSDDQCDIVSKRCKFESMNISVNTSTYPIVNGCSGIYHRTIVPQDLAIRLNKSKPVLILDCRPFFAYNANHIQGAVNINCSDRFNRRRLQQGKCSLVDLVASKEGKDLYKKRSSKEIIVYDDRTKDIKDVATDATLCLVLTVLRREGKQASVLKGNII